MSWRSRSALAIFAGHGVADAIATFVGMRLATGGGGMMISLERNQYLRGLIDRLVLDVGLSADLAVALAMLPVLLGAAIAAGLLWIAWRPIRAVPGSSIWIGAVVASGYAIPVANIYVALSL